MFDYIKAIHIIFIVTWFAGLFYIVRLFIYHTETQQKDEPAKSILSDQYKLMSKRLWYGITWPGMVGTYIFGFWMVFLNSSYYFSSAWFLLKLIFVFGLTLYHLQCHVMFLQLRKDVFKHSSLKLRMWNEVATVFLVAIVFIVILKNRQDFIWGLLGLVLFSAMIYLGIQIYKKIQGKE